MGYIPDQPKIKICFVLCHLGYGVYVNTSTGSVLVDDSTVVRDNYGDGIKYNFHRSEPDRSASDSFQVSDF